MKTKIKELFPEVVVFAVLTINAMVIVGAFLALTVIG